MEEGGLKESVLSLFLTQFSSCKAFPCVSYLNYGHVFVAGAVWRIMSALVGPLCIHECDVWSERYVCIFKALQALVHVFIHAVFLVK